MHNNVYSSLRLNSLSEFIAICYLSVTAENPLGFAVTSHTQNRWQQLACKAVKK